MTPRAAGVIFGRKFVLAELYDLVLTLGEMVLQADSPSTRSSCAHLFLTFLLRYPLGPKRVQQHLSFLVTNLPYPTAQGRLSLLSLVQTAIEQLPLPVLLRQMDLLLLPLVTRVVNDEHAECRAAVGSAITALLRRTCGRSTEHDAECDAARAKLLKLVTLWSKGTAAGAPLQRAAAQLAGLAVDGLGADLIHEELLPLLVDCCQRAARTQKRSGDGGDGDADGDGDDADGEWDGELDDDIDGAFGDADEDGASTSAADANDRDDWQPVYYSLRALLKMASSLPNLLLSEACDSLWPAVQTLLLHTHAWVRSAAGCAIGHVLSLLQVKAVLAAGSGAPQDAGGVSDSGGKKKGKKARARAASVEAGARVPAHFARRGALLELADASLHQLHSNLISEAAGDQALKNILWVCRASLEHADVAPESCRAMLRALARPLVEMDEGVDVDEADILAGVGRGATGGAANGGGDGGADGGTGGGSDTSVSWLIEAVASRLVPLLHKQGSVRGASAMRWFAAICAHLDPPDLNALLPCLLGPVARAADDESGKVHPMVRELAAEALQLLQRRADAPAFVAAYQKVKDAQRAVRRDRKRREALEAVANPALAATKRIAKNVGKRDQKKRKLDATKKARDSKGDIGLGSKKKARKLTVQNN